MKMKKIAVLGAGAVGSYVIWGLSKRDDISLGVVAKRIGLNFPVFKDGGEVTELLWDKGNTVETVVLMQYCGK